jgi:[ribosomal protein S5]-alanine N-acetyltransferase
LTELRGRRIQLREFSLADADAVAAWSGDPAVTRYLTWDGGDRDRALSFIRFLVGESARQPRQIFELAVVEISSGEVVGAAGLRVRNWQHRRADVGYVLRRDRWGRGYITEAVGLLIGLGFELGMHRIEATCHPDNRASARVMEKSGMRYEGRLRHLHHVRGEWRDSLLYAIVAGDPPD